MPTTRAINIEQKQRDERQRIFGDESGEEVWSFKRDKGYSPIPRTIPLILRLLSKSSDTAKGNPARVYFDLWAQCSLSSFVKIENENAFAYSAGYEGERGVRTWRDHMRVLQKKGFIKVQPLGGNNFGYVLLRDPYKVIEEQIIKGDLTDGGWINAFIARASVIGAKLPPGIKNVIKLEAKKAGLKRA